MKWFPYALSDIRNPDAVSFFEPRFLVLVNCELTCSLDDIQCGLRGARMSPRLHVRSQTKRRCGNINLSILRSNHSPLRVCVSMPH